MSIARISDSGPAADENSSAIPVPGLAIAGLLVAGVVAFIRRRERIGGSVGDEVPDALREDVGLPRRQADIRGWWEWR